MRKGSIFYKEKVILNDKTLIINRQTLYENQVNRCSRLQDF